MAVTLPLRDRLSFLHRLPLLLKGTSDDEVPCPGYLFEEIAKISHESLGSSQCLLEYLLNRLHGGSGHVKLKVLKILLHLCTHGSSSFLLLLKRNPSFIQEATVFAGPPDPLHGISLYQKVRAAAQDLGSTLFSDALSPLPVSQPSRALPPTGMGSQSWPQSTLQGFGYSKDHGHSGSAGEAFLSTIQKAAKVMASAIRPADSPNTKRPLPRGNTYQPAVTPLASQAHPSPRSLLSGVTRGTRAVRHQPGQAGGGWDEADSSPGSQGSSQGTGDATSKTSERSSPSSSDSPLEGRRVPSDLRESRVEAAGLSDCQQELSLVQDVMRGPHTFLSREEAQRFVKECSRLNCEVVLRLLLSLLGEPGPCAQMRALSALAALGGTDLLPQEYVLLLAQPRLQELSIGSPGPVTNKATKVLRHFEAACRHRPPTQPSPSAACRYPSDLLADSDAVPFAFLQPVTSSLLPPKGPAHPMGLQPSVELPLSLEDSPLQVPEDSKEKLDTPKAGRPPSLVARDSSLFAGMELVACPCLPGIGTMAQEPLLGTPGPWTLSPRGEAKEPPDSEQSVFAFLNS
ncbi:AP-4 complex accessory subunit tepsin isoform X2 [Erinaceus europaeus]|uniref:AP-4 complex accessory subunit tepsin isoform X2 n=1 Tax=Erinaceus europaeus TaxID=9365 RepID=A0ABM3VTW9_ERIEU|nr:AP-4 complex accessory subunit tepsin isoform X2 [Erinaceus europaeus]